MKKIDQRDGKTINKCKDCKYSRKCDSRNLVCCHEKYKNSYWGGTSAMKGISTFACEDFEKR